MPPLNLTLVCDNPFSITLSWIADFNGGDKQTFHVFFSSGEKNSSFKELTTLDDDGFGQIHSYSPAVKLKGQLWFRIAASNKFGNTTTDAIPCFIKSKSYINDYVSFLDATRCCVHPLSIKGSGVKAGSFDKTVKCFSNWSSNSNLFSIESFSPYLSPFIRYHFYDFRPPPSVKFCYAFSRLVVIFSKLCIAIFFTVLGHTLLDLVLFHTTFW